MLAALTMLCQTSFAAPQAISSEGLRADVALLRTAFENLHPGLYRYNSKQKMDEQFGELNRRFSKDQTLPEASSPSPRSPPPSAANIPIRTS